MIRFLKINLLILFFLSAIPYVVYAEIVYCPKLDIAVLGGWKIKQTNQLGLEDASIDVTKSRGKKITLRCMYGANDLNFHQIVIAKNVEDQYESCSFNKAQKNSFDCKNK